MLVGNFSTAYYNGGASTTATYNPFRYRGYYYDAELGFFYKWKWGYYWLQYVRIL